ncbi:coiled-coil domain-containing protein [Neobacillus bataviensis]|uniref:coiled-coil domain-containing protein n=1 Tax=Neobacillus bataviensis TaxID=220685 RepID=UPI001CC0F54F|nr:C40 family peptidase [Neobacillus bataviensis]
MHKKLMPFSAALIFLLGSFSVMPGSDVKAEGINSIQNQRSGIQNELNKTNEEITKVQDELTKLTEQIERVDQAIIDNNNMIVQTEAKVIASKKEVEELVKEVSSIKGRIDKRNEIIKKRALSFQESGGKVSYIDVFLGSSSFRDFVDRLGAVATIVEADQDLVRQHKEDQIDVERKQLTVEEKLADLNSLKTELEGMQALILEQKQQNDALKEELKLKEQEKLNEKANLQQQDSNLAVKETDLLATGSFSSDPSSVNFSIPISPNEAINIVIHAGEKYIGNSVYVFGGGRNAADIANGRFDCSAFVSWAFAQAGIKVGAHTDILKNTGTRVPYSDARPGDMVFFDTYKIDGHVGIYLGDGKFIGSQSSTGIAIADLSSGYYAKKFNGRVMRVIND